jgi:hypothetical protein
MDQAAASRSFTGYDRQSANEWSVLRYVYNGEKSRSVILRGTTEGVSSPPSSLQPVDTLPITPAVHDGLSIFYFARNRAASDGSVTVQTIVQGNSGETELRFNAKRSSLRINAVPHSIPVVQVNGTARFTGVFGLTGEFTGWFTDDDARVPVRASFEVIIGAVRLELVQWKRKGWSPGVGSSAVGSNAALK